MPATRADLRTAIRNASDTVNNTGMISDTWLNWVIDNAIAEVWDILTMAFQQYAVSSFTFALSSTNRVSIAAVTGGFYKDVGLNYIPTANRPITVDRIDSFADRNAFEGKRYFISGDSLIVYPEGGNYAGNYEFFYTPDPPALTADSGANGTIPAQLQRWKELIEISGAIMVMNKREMSALALEKRLALLTQRVKDAAARRMAGPAKIPMRDKTAWSINNPFWGDW